MNFNLIYVKQIEGRNQSHTRVKHYVIDFTSDFVS